MSEIRAVIFDCYSTLIDIKTDEQKDDIFNYLALYLQYYGAKIDAGHLRADIDLKREQHLKSKDEPYPEVDLEIIFKEILKEKGLNSPFLAESCCKLFRLLSRERFQLFPDSHASSNGIIPHLNILPTTIMFLVLSKKRQTGFSAGSLIISISP